MDNFISYLINNLNKVGSDPKFNTSIQRSWNYIKDPGIKAIEESGINNTVKIPIPQQDNYLSLPLGSNFFSSILYSAFYDCTIYIFFFWF